MFLAITAGIWSWVYLGRQTTDSNNVHVSSSTASVATKTEDEIKTSLCLEKNRTVAVRLEKNNDGSGVAIISLMRGTENENVFKIDNIVSATHYHPIESQRCNLFAIRNRNDKFGVELWSYDYQGDGTKLLDLAGTDSSGKSVVYYQYDFRVSPDENYLSLIRGYLGRDDYAIVIKSFPSLDDAFILPITEIEKRNPELVQDISFENGGWARDGRYFWADTHLGANTLGFIRIDMETKTFDFLPAPADVLGGDALNLEKGLITVHPGNVWFGIQQVTDAEIAKRRAEGMGTELYIENLFTHERQFVTSTTEPLWYFKPLWISSATLQYTLPSGATTTYTISQ